MNLRTRGEGVKNSENFANVIYGHGLDINCATYNLNKMHIRMQLVTAGKASCMSSNLNDRASGFHLLC